MNTKTQTCYDCGIFNRKLGICIEHHMGDKPEYYNKPKWMGCSWREDKNKNLLTLFKEEKND